MTQDTTNVALRRQVGVGGAVMLGLGSIVGTGVFGSIALGVELTGAGVVAAIAVAAIVATCNGLSSAQLAAAYPVSGGTYEYGYRLLHPAAGFTAGWVFLLAKSASAATAALYLAGYVQAATGLDSRLTVPLALVGVAVLTALVATGIRRSNAVNILIVSITLAALACFVAVGVWRQLQRGSSGDLFTLPSINPSWFEAAALMFVAYTGYGRIATLGEEIIDPRRNIPRAMIATLGISMLVYVAVAAVLVMAWTDASSTSAAKRDAPLAWAATQAIGPAGGVVLGVGAVTAMAGVLLNLLLGLSRVLLAMGRRGDAPAAAARVSGDGSPVIAVVAVGGLIAGIVLVGQVKLTWSFSAFTVLIYYALTNLAALQLPPERRLFARAWAWGGLGACVFLAFWVAWPVWVTGLGLIAAGLVWHRVGGGGRRRAKPQAA